MMEFVRKKPDWAKSCEYFDEKAEGYICFLMSGKKYYVPLTKEMKALWGISRSKDHLIFKVHKNQDRLNRILMDLAGSLLLQVRDTIGVSITADLSQQLTEFIEEKFDDKMFGVVRERLGQRLLPEAEVKEDEIKESK